MTTSVLPGGPAVRHRAAGAKAGAPLTRIDGPGAALGLVAEELAAAELALMDLVQSDVRAVPEVAGYLVAAGGKRLRPALTALGARVVGMEPAPVRLMCVGELLHLGSLLHDDVVDDGDTRRDRPAAHRVYGNAVTVLTGDFCLARAVLLAAEEGGFDAVRALGDVVTEMAEGEVLQLQRAGDLSCTVEPYLDVVARKSAALIAWCVRAPALATGMHEEAALLEGFGRAVGIAFQITDDVLDYSDSTGKSRGSDLRERKVTLPLIRAMERLPGLRAELERGEPDPAHVDRLVREIRASGALDTALEDARGYVRMAVSALDGLPESTGLEALRVLAHHLVERVR
ncbi:MAG: polyprenyl synthetase family protein [Alphaproteobacteria bacterium]|nr:polyprenyl synthetase family protein [Alphaproteobacteria bacterium]